MSHMDTSDWPFMGILITEKWVDLVRMAQETKASGKTLVVSDQERDAIMMVDKYLVKPLNDPKGRHGPKSKDRWCKIKDQLDRWAKEATATPNPQEFETILKLCTPTPPSVQGGQESEQSWIQRQTINSRPLATGE